MENQGEGKKKRKISFTLYSSIEIECFTITMYNFYSVKVTHDVINVKVYKRNYTLYLRI